MPSAASPRAVNISTGVSDFTRSSRHTSSPSTSGSIRSSTTASKGSRTIHLRPARPSATTATRKPASPRYSATISARRGSSSIRSMRPPMRRLYRSSRQRRSSGLYHGVGATHRMGRRAVPCFVPALPSAPGSLPAMALDVLGDSFTLLRSKDFGRVRSDLRDAPGRLLGELNVLGAQRFDRSAIDCVAREQLYRLRARRLHLPAQRQQIRRRLFHDRCEPLLLFLRGIDLDVEMLEHAIEVLVHVRRVEGAGCETTAEPAVAAAVAKGLIADPRGDATDQCGKRDALEKLAASFGTWGLCFHDPVLSWFAGNGSPGRGVLPLQVSDVCAICKVV